MSRFRILLVGGYGHFGSRICRGLAHEPNVVLVIAGRRPQEAATLVAELRAAGADVETALFDHAAPDAGASVRALAPDLVVHTSGPFQGQGYHVARAAIDAGAHYLDLADGRAFVCGIGALDASARERGVLVASGASTLPAVSGAILDELARGYERIDAIVIVIAPGQATPRGRATLASVLSYCGQPFETWRDGAWQRVHGWQDLRRVELPGLGARWAARCDVPDLALLPARYPGVRTVRFDAALELAVEHAGLWTLGWLVRAGLVRAPEALSGALVGVAGSLDRFGSDVGGMLVRVDGERRDRQRGFDAYGVVARQGHGPEIPCLPAIVLARKLARGEPVAPGARPCYGMTTLGELKDASARFDIAWDVDSGFTPAAPAA